MQNGFSKNNYVAPRRGKTLAFIFKRAAVGAFCFGGVGFVGANLNSVKAAAVAVFAVIGAVVNVASDVSVCIHNKKTSFCFDFIFNRKAGFIQEKRSILKKHNIKIS